jgi:uncharacterized low-complexity protein
MPTILEEESIMKRSKQTALTLALGSAIAASLSAAPVNAAENPFAAQSMAKGYMVAEADKAAEGKCGAKKETEGKCGAKAKEGKCGGEKSKEGKCGDTKAKTKAKPKEGKKSTEDEAANKKMLKEGKCGEGKCGAKNLKEGKCGEGKCGTKK